MFLILKLKNKLNKKLRVLIYNNFKIYKTFKVLKFCFKNNIILCRLSSYTSYKL
jgi:hypothetical protein